MADKRKYTVGYGKPPKSSQFKKGNRANPKGRGKTKNLKTDLREELSEKITLHENGERKFISKQRAMIKAAVAKALQGDMRAMGVLTTLTVKLLEAELAEETKDLSPQDVAIFEAYIRQLCSWDIESPFQNTSCWNASSAAREFSRDDVRSWTTRT